MGKKYFFFSGCNFKDDDKDDEGEMGRRRNKNKNKNKHSIKETRPRFAPDLDDDGVFGFAGGAVRKDDDSGRVPIAGSGRFVKHDSGRYSSSWSSYSSSFSSSNEKKQTSVNSDNVISTSRGFFEVHHSEAWGSVLIPVEDPKAMTITIEDVETIKLIENFPKIPARLWSRVIKLYCYQCYEVGPQSKPVAYRQWCSETRDFEFYTYHNSQKTLITNPLEVTGPNAKYTQEHTATYTNYTKQLEVSVLLCRKLDDPTQWKILVPKQQVSHASVNADLTKKCVDIETGEAHDVFPPPGWLHAGSSHSHNTMGAFFSGTDDHSELTVPGLHIVVGSIKRDEGTYDVLASIVLRQCRKRVDIKTVVEDEHIEDVTFHSNVLECISNNSYSGSSSSSSSSSDSAYGRSHDDTPYEGLRRNEGLHRNPSDRFPFSPIVEDKSEEERPSHSLILKGSEITQSSETDITEEIETITVDKESWWSRWKARFLSSYKPYSSDRSIGRKHLPKGPPSGCSLNQPEQPEEYFGV